MTTGSGGCSIGTTVKTVNMEIGALDVSGTPVATESANTINTNVGIPNTSYVNILCKINNKISDIITIPTATYSYVNNYVKHYTLTEPYVKTIATDFIPGTIYRVELFVEPTLNPFTVYLSYTGTYTVDSTGKLTITIPTGTVYYGLGSSFNSAVYSKV